MYALLLGAFLASTCVPAAVATASAFTVAWSTACAGGIGASPALSADGALVFIGDGGGIIRAVNTSSGTTVWTYVTRASISSSPKLTPDGMTVVCGSDDFSVNALDAATGALRWNASTLGYVYGSAGFSPDGAATYIGSDDGKLYAYSVANGAPLWTLSTGGPVRSSPAVDSATGVLYFGSDDGAIRAVFANGTVQWSLQTADLVRSTPRLRDGALVIGTYDRRILELDSATGAVRWQLSTAERVRSAPFVRVLDGAVFVGGFDSCVYSIGSDGTLRWNTSLPPTAIITSNPALYTDNSFGFGAIVIAGSWNGAVVALSQDTGALLANTTTGGSVAGSPAIGTDGTIYIGSADGRLYALRLPVPPSPPSTGGGGIDLSSPGVIAGIAIGAVCAAAAIAVGVVFGWRRIARARDAASQRLVPVRPW